MSQAQTLQFNKDVYTEQAIEAAIELYKDFATWSFSQSADAYFEVSYADPDPDVEGNLADEFSNYALFASIEGKQS